MAIKFIQIIALMLSISLCCSSPTEPEKPHVNVQLDFSFVNCELYGTNILIATTGITKIEAWFFDEIEIEVSFKLYHNLKCSENKKDYTLINEYAHNWTKDEDCGSERSQYAKIEFENVLHEFPKMEFGSYYAEVSYRYNHTLCGMKKSGASKTKISEILYLECL